MYHVGKPERPRGTMARLGHSTPKAAMLYQQVASGRAEEIAAGLSRLAEKG
jgi:hypothetical protein